MTKIVRILLIITVALLTFSLGAMLGYSVTKANEPERIGIFTQPDGSEIIEICYKDSKCTQEKVSKEELEKMEKENGFNE